MGPPNQSMPGRPVEEVPTLQPQPNPQMNNMQPGPGFQVIALPAGAPPPEGAIPVPAGQTPEQLVQMIALPVGETPPEGAIPVGEAAPLPTARKAFKIKDPRTGLEVDLSAHDETASTASTASTAGASTASRRLRIVNPKTGE